MEIIYSYTRQQALRDGVLRRLEDFLRHELPEDEKTIAKLDWLRSIDGKFLLGELVITPAAAHVLHPTDVLTCLMRHRLGDWGHLDEEDRATNEYALKNDERLFSAYHVPDKNDDRFEIRFYVITEWNCEATTVLLPEDY